MIDDFRPMPPRKPTPKLKPTPAKTDTAQEQTVPFKTPEQVREHTALHTALASPISLEPKQKPPKQSKLTDWFRSHFTWPPKRPVLMAVVGVLLIIGTAAGSYYYLRQPIEATDPVTRAKRVPPKPTTVASALSGLQVAPEINERPVVGVMVENSKSARPQSGLSQAGVVFEAIAEGGITRFLALYQDQHPESIGPIRSARPYYVQWSEGFRAAYAHVGGSPEALQNIKDWGVQDINQFYNASVFHRVSSRPSPHNVYANVGSLTNLATQKGFKSEFTGFVRKPAAASKQPTATGIDLAISSQLYNVHYAYDSTTNTYKRFEGGEAHLDNNTNDQLAPNVVVAMVVPLGAGSKTAQGGSYSNYNVIGSGEVFIFQDGLVTTGTWHKAGNTNPITFTDADNNPIAINPGQTWISAVATGSKVTYK